MAEIDKNYSRRDKMAVWHSHIRQWEKTTNHNIIRGKGAWLYDDMGNRFIDAISSGGVNLHGHAHPLINQRISEQLSQLEYSPFTGFTHPKAIDLADKLLRLLPDNQGKIFYSNDESSAVEVAIKMTLQYWKNKAEDRKTFIVLEHDYHGSSFGAQSVSYSFDKENALNHLDFQVKFIPMPIQNNLESVLLKIDEIHKEYQVAGFIFEPLVQFHAGMRMHKAEYLEQLIYRCQKWNIITIANEAITAFGRTGAMFACEHLGTSPDIFCLANSLTAGYMTLGATSCSAKVFHGFLKREQPETLNYAQSYTASPLACTAALASLEIFKQDAYIEEIIRIVYKHQAFAQYLQTHPQVENVRQMGTILAFEIKIDNSEDSSPLLNYRFLERGVIIQAIKNTVYFIPPYCTSNEDLDRIYAATLSVLKVI
ncbi:MAG: adenosylmethionine--8-amino-7-oxononanoate transaminase [Chitinophagales bacterium]|nr:adenosylmethionine--8-amino-7-oxononanoate transaminase [Chitinophagales bacterium]